MHHLSNCNTQLQFCSGGPRLCCRLSSHRFSPTGKEKQSGLVLNSNSLFFLNCELAKREKSDVSVADVGFAGAGVLTSPSPLCSGCFFPTLASSPEVDRLQRRQRQHRMECEDLIFHIIFSELSGESAAAARQSDAVIRRNSLCAWRVFSGLESSINDPVQSSGAAVLILPLLNTPSPPTHPTLRPLHS